MLSFVIDLIFNVLSLFSERVLIKFENISRVDDIELVTINIF